MKKIYTLYGYFDLDGAVACTLVFRHMSLLQKQARDKNIIIEVEPVFRPKTHRLCVSAMLRKNYAKFGFSEDLLIAYDDLIDCVELLNSTKGCSKFNNLNPFSFAQRLYSLFNTKHPIIDKRALYRDFVSKMAKNPSIEEFLDSDTFYAQLISYAENKI